ncbi:MAG: type VII secretion integral membrane protein EccD, partial [Mycobacteriaceae bacterium]|nr:type VII secretion integral membrane protein EccD [Mycobacteriaceae bacterium]
ARFYAADVTATALELCGLALVFGGAALAVPGRLGSPHLLLGCVATLFAAVVTFRVGGVGATVVAAVITVAVLGGLAATVHMVWEPAVPKAAAGLLVAAIALISATPRSAVALARLPVPPVPTAGAAIDPVDQDERPTIEGIGVIGATALPSAAGLEQRARAANRYQSGMVVGCTITAVTAGFATADPFGATRWQGVALAVVAGLVLCLRGRAFADLTQAAAMIGGGCAGLVSVAIALAIGHPALLVPAAGVLIGSAIAAILFGAVGPSIEVSPVTRRKFELFEYLLIVSIVPLVFWTMDLYALARNR